MSATHPSLHHSTDDAAQEACVAFWRGVGDGRADVGTGPRLKQVIANTAASHA